MVGNRVHIGRILCPVDFSEFSSRALEHAVALAGHFAARVDLLHVVPSAVSPSGGGSFPARSELLQYAGLELRRCAGLAVQSRISVQTDLREGEPWRQIEAAAASLPADLVVMGTHGRAGFEHFLLGSVAEKVLRRAPCPVLTVGLGSQPPQPSGLFNRILCATDLSETSTATVALALSLAEEQQAELTLLHVLEGLQLYQHAPELEGLRRQLQDAASEQLAAAVAAEARQWCSVRQLVKPGRAHHEILKVAAEAEADLIVMGASGQGSLGRMLFGSTSQGVVRAAHCPVLTVRSIRERQAVRAQSSRAATQDLQPAS
jgi:nucleotide-binding universal stress UspA family protein